MRAIDLAPPNWASALLDAIESSAREDGLEAVMETVTTSMANSSAAMGRLDTYPHAIALVAAQRISVKHQHLPLKHFISVSLPNLFECNASPLANAQLAASATSTISRMIKHSLLVLSHTDPASADVHAAAVLDELTYQRQLPVKRNLPSPQSKKRRVDEIEGETKLALEVIVQALAGDEELKSRWERFGDMAQEAR